MRSCWLLAGVLLASVSHAEPLYVIEQLVVSVSSEPGGAGEKVASIKSGDAVELLEKRNGDARVRLASGAEGWVRSSYLSAQEPLQKRLTERTAAAEKLEQEVSRLQAELAAARDSKSTTAPTSTAAPRNSNSTAADPAPGAAAPADPGTPRATDTANTPVNEPSYFMTEPEQPARPVWHWILLSCLLTLGLGFALGWWVLDRRIRRKYGGLRIY